MRPARYHSTPEGFLSLDSIPRLFRRSIIRYTLLPITKEQRVDPLVPSPSKKKARHEPGFPSQYPAYQHDA